MNQSTQVIVNGSAHEIPLPECTAEPLESRTMGDACPRCGGVDYYCVAEAHLYIDHLLAELAVMHAKVQQFRRALEFLEPSARELLEVAATETVAYRRRWQVAIEQASAVCAALDDLPLFEGLS